MFVPQRKTHFLLTHTPSERCEFCVVLAQNEEKNVKERAGTGENVRILHVRKRNTHSEQSTQEKPHTQTHIHGDLELKHMFFTQNWYSRKERRYEGKKTTRILCKQSVNLKLHTRFFSLLYVSCSRCDVILFSVVGVAVIYEENKRATFGRIVLHSSFSLAKASSRYTKFTFTCLHTNELNCGVCLMYGNRFSTLYLHTVNRQT